MFDALAALVEKYKILSLDLETTGLDTDKDTILLIAMAAGWGNRVATAAVSPTGAALAFVKSCMSRPDMRIVGHNIITFDTQMLHKRGVIRLEDIKAKLIDTLPLSWLLNERPPHKLKILVKRYLGKDMVTYEEAYLKSEAMMALKRAQFELSAIDAAEGSAFKSAIKQVKIARLEKARNLRGAKKAGLIDITLADIASMTKKAFGDAEIDRVAAEIKRTLSLRRSELQAEARVMSVRAEREQKAYAKDDARRTLSLYAFCRNRLDKMGLTTWSNIEMEVRKIALKMGLTGLVVDRDIIAEIDTVVGPLLDEFEAEVYNEAKQEFDINSPQQLSEVLYDGLGIPQIGEIRIGKDGKEIDETRSTKEQILARMAHPIAQIVLNFRTLSKLRSSFIKKLLTLLDNSYDGRIHPKYNTTVRTGRWSCADPNVQNIPSRKKGSAYDERIQGLGVHIRKAFKAPKGKKFIGADLSQVELRLIAHETQDNMMLSIYTEFVDYDGIRYYTGDIHATVAAQLKVSRKTAKNIVFGLCYGMSAGGFARYARIMKEGVNEYDLDKANYFRDGFMGMFAGLPVYLDDIRNMRDAPIPKCNFRTLSGRFRRFPKNEKAFPGKIFNSIIQGGAADVLKAIIWALDKYVLGREEFAGTELVLQVHDEVGLYAPEEIADKVGILVKYTMEQPWFALSVPVLASVKVCDDWSAKDDDSVPEVGVLPPKESGIKPCVAMLTSKDREWAAQYVKTIDFTFIPEEDKDDF